MPRPSRHPALLPALLLLVPGLLLPSCAPPNPTAAAGAAPAATPPAFPFGHRVDSLNGIAGHRFGEPLRAFPRLHLEPPDTGVPLRSYTSGASTGWFGQHRAQVPDQYYTFFYDQFFAFVALGDPAVLKSEATHRFQPDLWESRAGIELDYVDLARLTQRLAHSPLVPELDPPIYCGDACYLAELLDYFQQVASSLRSELKAGPLAQNARLMALIERLAVGNAVAERVLQETRNEPQRATTDPA